MKEWTNREFIRLLKDNGYTLLKNRGKGTHSIYQKNGKHISVPKKIEAPVARRLIKENDLKYD